jgi:hypothetical protein
LGLDTPFAGEEFGSIWGKKEDIRAALYEVVESYAVFIVREEAVIKE